LQQLILITISGIGLFLPIMAQAQGTLYFSSLGQTPTGSAAIGSDSWIAQGFGTGTNTGGYILNSVQLLMDGASGGPNGFAISIYTKSGNSPQNNLGNLVGSDPLTGGVYSYTASGITLSPSTAYYILVTSATPVAQGSYNWSSANVLAPLNNGWAGGLYDYSTDGATWNYFRDQFFQFAIYATPIPEPATCALFGLGSLAFLWHRRKSKAVG
jgi:hypothetical protein